MSWETVIPAILMVIAFITLTVTLLSKLGEGFANERKARETSADKIMAGQSAIRTDFKTTFDALEKRIDRVEQKSVDFMPRSEITNAISHERGNRLQADDSLKRLIDHNTEETVKLRVEIGVLHSQHDGMERQVCEVKNLVVEQRKDNAAMFEKVFAKLDDLNRK